MAKGMLKFMMLSILSGTDATGYELMKKIEAHAGHKPSTGSIYPLLKSMQNDGWIEGKEDGEKTIYKITELGIEKFNEFDRAHGDYVMKMHQSISSQMADHPDISHAPHMDLFSHFIHKALELVDEDTNSDEIEGILLKALQQLDKLKGDKHD